MANFLRLSGIVCKIPLYNISPSGIPHCQFIIEHHSLQEEAGFHRQAWCRVPVIVSGHENKTMTKNITIGVNVTIQGFVSCHKAKNGLNQIVLHAKQVKLVDSGD